MKWYKEAYFDPCMWLLANGDKLGVSNDELVFLLMIVYADKAGQEVDYDYLCRKLSKSRNDVDQVIASLVSKRYLDIKASASGLVFSIESVFAFDPSVYEVVENEDAYDIMTELLRRPMSPTEIQKTSDLIEKYGQDAFLEAVRIAEAYRKVSLSYIEGILRNHE